MGEYAEYILNGDDCQYCGEHLGDGDGFPRSCASCASEMKPGPDDGGRQPQGPARSKWEKRRRKRHRLRDNRLARLEQTDTAGWRQCSPYHFQKTIDDMLVNWWPSRRKCMIEGEVFQGVDGQAGVMERVERRLQWKADQKLAGNGIERHPSAS